MPLYLNLHPQHHLTLHPPRCLWQPIDLIRYNRTILRNIDRLSWHALQVGQTWPQAVIPTLLLSSSRLIIGCGGKLLVHPIADPPEPGGGKVVERAREYPIARKGSGSGTDIIGVVDLEGDLGIAQYDGTLQRFQLRKNGQLRSVAHFPHPKGSNVHTLSASPDGGLMMTTTALGLVSLFKTHSPWIRPETFELAEANRAWSSKIITNHQSLSPSLLFGVHGGIVRYHLLPTGPDPNPESLLYGANPASRASPYDLVLPPHPSVHHPSLLLSAWYDSHLRLHDLRSSSRGPVAEFSDPWQWADGSAMYCATFLAENYIAGGGARHGAVAIFDVRNAKKGWSAFSPAGKGSPVYALEGEGGRLWGVSQKRAFVLAFDGSGAKSEGLVAAGARAQPEKTRVQSHGWSRRGGRRGWLTAADDSGDDCKGYSHDQRGLALFRSLRAA